MQATGSVEAAHSVVGAQCHLETDFLAASQNLQIYLFTNGTLVKLSVQVGAGPAQPWLHQ